MPGAHAAGRARDPRRRPHGAGIHRLLAQRRARERPPRARDRVSTELWECLNTTRARMPRKVASDKVHEFFAWVRERSALAVGIIESATSRDEAWQFFTLGRSIERADMTARLLATRSLTEASRPVVDDHPALAAARTRRTCAPTAACRARATPPSSCCSTGCSRAASCSRSRAPSSACATSSRAPTAVGVSDQAQRLLGQIRSELEYRPIAEIIDDLPAAHGQRAARDERRQRGDPPALLPDQRGAELGRGDHDEPAAHQARDRLPLRRRGHRVVQRGADAAGELRRPARAVLQPRDPADLDHHSYVDYWGTRVSSFEILTPHNELSLTATSLVEVRPRAAPRAPARPGRRSPTRSSRPTEYVEQLEQTRAHASAGRGGRASRAMIAGDATNPCEAALAICTAIGDADRVHVRASPACTPRPRRRGTTSKGVCQDITHLALGALRVGRHPGALRQSGYLHPQPDAAIGETIAGRVARVGRVVLRRRGAASTPPTSSTSATAT